MKKHKAPRAKKRRAKRKPFKHLDQQGRDRMEALLREGEKQKTVAAILKVDPSTVSRERKKRKRKIGVL